MTTLDCDEFRDTAPDLALGLLTGGERGAAISHVVTCASCRRHLDALVQVADDLLLLAPSVEPEIGFESRVMARLAAGGAFSPAPSVPHSSALPSPSLSPSTSPSPSPSTSPSVSPALSPSPSPSLSPWTPPSPNPETATVGAAESVDSLDSKDDAGPGPAGVPAPAPSTPGSEGPAGPAGARTDRRSAAGRRPGAGRHRGPTSPSRPRVGQRRRVFVVSALALAVVTGAMGLTAGLTRGRDAGRTAAFAHEAKAADQLAARTVVVWADNGQSWCQLVAFPGHGNLPASLVVHLEEPGDPPGSYQVLAEPANGQPAVLVGTIHVAGGHGTLTAEVPAGTGPVDAIRVVDAARVLRYRATFASV